MKGGQIYQRQEAVDRDPPLHRLEIARPFFVLASREVKEGVEEVNKAVPINHEEGELFNPLGVDPCERAKDLVGRPPGLGPGSDGEVNGGARQATSGLRCFIVPHTQRPIF